MPYALLRAALRNGLDQPFSWDDSVFDSDVIVDVPISDVPYLAFMERLTTEVLESFSIFDETDLKPADLVGIIKVGIMLADGHISRAMTDNNWMKTVRMVKENKSVCGPR